MFCSFTDLTVFLLLFFFYSSAIEKHTSEMKSRISTKCISINIKNSNQVDQKTFVIKKKKRINRKTMIFLRVLSVTVPILAPEKRNKLIHCLQKKFLSFYNFFSHFFTTNS